VLFLSLLGLGATTLLIFSAVERRR
jgi:hypothetical protein